MQPGNCPTHGEGITAGDLDIRDVGRSRTGAVADTARQRLIRGLRLHRNLISPAAGNCCLEGERAARRDGEVVGAVILEHKPGSRQTCHRAPYRERAGVGTSTGSSAGSGAGSSARTGTGTRGRAGAGSTRSESRVAT